MKGLFNDWIVDFGHFLRLLTSHFLRNYLMPKLNSFESIKSVVVGKMYEKRGKHAGLIVNAGVLGVMVLGIALGPSLIVNDPQTSALMPSGFGGKLVFAQGDGTGGAKVLGLSTDTQMNVDPLTQVSDKPRAEILDYTVEGGDTLSSIAKKFGVDTDSIKWLNPDVSEKKVKVGVTLKIPPVTGVVHTVKSGETIYSIAKRYNVSAQAVVDFPFNEFSNDETFALAVGQTLVIPDGEMPNEVLSSPKSYLAQKLTPNAGAVSATGNWIWPTAGTITQWFKSWHKGLDIANHAAPAVLAADSGKVVHASWDKTGYGNMVLVDHGNGYMTLYGHLQKFSVTVGQTVKRGDMLGQMGSTGRSTGTHLHFEIRTEGGNKDPLAYLK